ncbi:hypothetical protein [Microcoleus sp. FACHB-672]|nr:hypothetical protein [Microcoleus sp. FACHB-672]MBD2042753.1 hypothetical protein [Microcoleus sp. FACHB-672]
MISQWFRKGLNRLKAYAQIDSAGGVSILRLSAIVKDISLIAVAEA